MKKITRAYVTHFNVCTMEQELPSGRKIVCNWYRLDRNKWMPNYSTNSSYRICHCTGEFKSCIKCPAFDNDTVVWYAKCREIQEKQIINDTEMASRATDCANAEGCTVKFRSIDA